jgi:hypothetical protein
MFSEYLLPFLLGDADFMSSLKKYISDNLAKNKENVNFESFSNVFLQNNIANEIIISYSKMLENKGLISLSYVKH